MRTRGDDRSSWKAGNGGTGTGSRQEEGAGVGGPRGGDVGRRRRRWPRGLFRVAAAMAGVGAMPAMNGGTMPRLIWTRVADLPDAAGRKGMYGGTSGGVVLLAGGSNFPVPPAAGGKKTFHRDGWVRPVAAGAEERWRPVAEIFPEGRGEGAAVTVADGVVAIGGHDGKGPVAAVTWLRWDDSGATVTRQEWPELPEPAANAAAVVHAGWLYVAGGAGRAGALGTFWRLDASRAERGAAGAGWGRLPEWGGGGRFGCILNVVTTAAGPRLLLTAGLAGPAKSQADYLVETRLYDPAAGTWSRGADLPRGALLGGTVRLADGTGAVLGGSDGHDFTRMRELGERYRIPDDVWRYDGRAGRWSPAGTMPVGTVGAAVVALAPGRWLVAGGEYSPGRRTAQVFRLEEAAP